MEYLHSLLSTLHSRRNLLLVRGVDDLHEVGGLSSPQSTLRAERPDGHFLLRSLAAPLQMGPAALGSHLGGNSTADQAAVCPSWLTPAGSPVIL